MTIVLDKADIGKAGADPSSTTIAFTTSQTVATGGFIVVGIGFFNGTTVSSVSGGGLTWTVEVQGSGGIASHSALATAQAPSGLASGTTITATLATAGVARVIGGSSFTGVATSSATEATTAAVANTSTASWATGSASISAGSLMYAFVFNENNQTNTPTSPSLNAVNPVNAGGPNDGYGVYRIETSAGSYTVAGTWSASTTSVNVGAAFLAAAGGGGSVIPDITMQPLTHN